MTAHATRSLAEQSEYVGTAPTTTGRRAVHTPHILNCRGLGYLEALSFFEITRVSDEFYGTIWSSSGMRWTRPDTLEFYRYAGDSDYTVRNILTGEEMQGFYELSYLDTKDKYAAFLGGNSAHVRVTGKGADRPTLLLVKDSYANALVPFLAFILTLR